MELGKIELNPDQIMALKLASKKRNFALFMGAGTGKTYAALAIIKHKCEPEDKVFITCPKSVINDWKKSIKAARMTNYNIDIMGLELFARNGIQYTPHYIVIDEAHRMKDYNSKSFRMLTDYRGALGLSNVRKLLLTGTPSNGKLFELLTLACLCGIINSYQLHAMKIKHFNLDEYGVIISPKEGAQERMETLWANNSFKKTKTVLTDGAGKELELKVRVTKVEKSNNDVYDNIQNEWSITDPDGHVYAPHSGGIRKFKSHQIIAGFIKDRFGESHKLDLTYKHELLFRRLTSDRIDKTIIFTFYNYDVKVAKKMCRRAGKTYKELNGSTRNTQVYIQEITDFDYDVLIVNYKSGGVGLNLVKCRHIFMMTLPYSYIDYEQAIKRCYRIGQTRDVWVDVPVMKGTIDVDILRCIQNREEYHYEFMGVENE